MPWSQRLEGLTNEELEAVFEQATAYVPTCRRLGTNTKLGLYGCFKQASLGDCPQATAPGGIEASMKWSAWVEHRGESRETAMRRYVEVLSEAQPQWSDFKSSCAAAEEDLWDDDEELPDRSTDGFGNSVSTLGLIGGALAGDDVDESAVGVLNKLIADGRLEKVRQQLRRKPELAFEPDKDGMTPLHWAADRGRAEVVQLLITMAGHGAEAERRLNCADDSGDTPLHYAVMVEELDIARLLVAAGADPTKKNFEGEMAVTDAAILDSSQREGQP